MHTTSPTGVDAAVAMAELGYAVHPCRLVANAEGKKVPFGLPKQWQAGGLTDPAEIRRAWAAVNANAYLIACGPSGVTVVDLDRKGQTDGLMNWQTAGGPTAGFVVQTSSGGRHLYYQSTGSGNLRGVIPCVDVRGHGGGVFGPGSTVAAADGTILGGYTVVSGSPARSALTPEPSLLAVLNQGRKPASVTRDVTNPFFAPPPMHIGDALRLAKQRVAELAAMPNLPGTGMRQRINDTALYLGGLVHTGAFTVADAHAALVDACAKVYGSADADDLLWIETALVDGDRMRVRVQPDPAPDVDGPVTPSSAGPPGPSGSATRDGTSASLPAAPPGAMPRRLPMIDDDVWKGYRWTQSIRDRARDADICPDAVLGAMLATYAARIPPGVRIVTGTKMPLGTNLVVSLVGPSGSDKSTAFTYAQHLSPQAAVPVINNPNSGEAFAASYVQPDPDGEGAVSKRNRVLKPDPRALFYVPEGALVGSVGSRLGSTWLPHLRALAVDESLSTTNATSEINRQVPAMSYSAGVIVGFQVTTAMLVLSDTATGTAQRFLWFTSLSSEDETHTAELAEHVGMETPVLTRLGQSIDEANQPIYVLAVTAPITARIKAEQRAFRLTRDITATDDYDAHKHTIVAKLAAIGTLADGRVLIEERDWAWAELLYAASGRVRDELIRIAEESAHDQTAAAGVRMGIQDVQRRSVGGDVQRVAGVILRKVQQLGQATQTDISRAVSSRDKKRGLLLPAREMLEQHGHLAQTKEGTYYAPLTE